MGQTTTFDSCWDVAASEAWERGLERWRLTTELQCVMSRTLNGFSRKRRSLFWAPATSCPRLTRCVRQAAAAVRRPTLSSVRTKSAPVSSARAIASRLPTPRSGKALGRPRGERRSNTRPSGRRCAIADEGRCAGMNQLAVNGLRQQHEAGKLVHPSDVLLENQTNHPSATALRKHP